MDGAFELSSDGNSSQDSNRATTSNRNIKGLCLAEDTVEQELLWLLLRHSRTENHLSTHGNGDTHEKIRKGNVQFCKST